MKYQTICSASNWVFVSDNEGQSGNKVVYRVVVWALSDQGVIGLIGSNPGRVEGHAPSLGQIPDISGSYVHISALSEELRRLIK